MSDRIPNAPTSGSDAASTTNQQHVTDTGPEPGLRKAETGVHPIAIEVALAAALWFLAVTWVRFARGGEVDWGLLRAVPVHRDLWIEGRARWRQRDTSFREFLDSEVGTATGPMRGREVLLEIAVTPVSLALAATAIGLVGVVLH